jgi:hypothetical protein
MAIQTPEGSWHAFVEVLLQHMVEVALQKLVFAFSKIKYRPFLSQQPPSHTSSGPVAGTQYDLTWKLYHAYVVSLI